MMDPIKLVFSQCETELVSLQSFVEKTEYQSGDSYNFPPDLKQNDRELLTLYFVIKDLEVEKKHLLNRTAFLNAQIAELRTQNSNLKKEITQIGLSI